MLGCNGPGSEGNLASDTRKSRPGSNHCLQRGSGSSQGRAAGAKRETAKPEAGKPEGAAPADEPRRRSSPRHERRSRPRSRADAAEKPRLPNKPARRGANRPSREADAESSRLDRWRRPRTPVAAKQARSAKRRAPAGPPIGQGSGRLFDNKRRAAQAIRARTAAARSTWSSSRT